MVDINDINDIIVSVFRLGWICATRRVQVTNYIRSSAVLLEPIWLGTQEKLTQNEYHVLNVMIKFPCEFENIVFLFALIIGK